MVPRVLLESQNPRPAEDQTLDGSRDSDWLLLTLSISESKCSFQSVGCVSAFCCHQGAASPVQTIFLSSAASGLRTLQLMLS